MKEHKEAASEPAMERPALKSLLKKPGQTKAKGQKNRVVINEKMNEFFAADYIILIKEECCADYEEDCECCCQEHEMIRLGNCKECRAELDLRFEDGSGGGGGGSVLHGPDDACDEDDDEDDEEDDEDDDEDDVDDDEHICTQHHHHHEEVKEKQPVTPARRHQQRETLSPPEGYKDLCVAAQAQQELEENECGEDGRTVCAECDFYQRQAAESADDIKTSPASRDEPKQSNNAVHHQDNWRTGSSQESEDSSATSAGSGSGAVQQPTIDQGQQTTPDVQQRYLVETITMTTVTERRIVREISEEETRPTIDEADTTATNAERQPSIEHQKSLESVDKNGPPNGETSAKPDGSESTEKEKSTPELSLAFKLGTSSLVTNSLKPNSAVRQLFPDPRFISPPPAVVKSVSSDLEDGALDESGDNQKFLITTESLRMFDAVKRSKIGAGSRSDSSESDSSIKRTIERNALRRSLIKYDTGGTLKKKNLRSMDLTLEERIRQLTCVDEDEDTADSSASENNNTGRINSQNHNNNNNSMNVNGMVDRTIEGNGSDEQSMMMMHQLPARTSPSGEERPKTHVLQSHNSHHHHHQHPTNSAYRKITDLFGQKKNNSAPPPSELNLPDIGLGSKHSMAMKTSAGTKMNTEARKQFLASLAPLSCVASSGMDGKDDYYRMPAKMNPGDRNSVCYNSDSSYSLEDIEAALSEGIPAPPDVTRGTPTSAGPSMDAFGSDPTDELLAFVEQDKSRTERIKRRYNDVDEHHRNDNNMANTIEIPKNVVNLNNDDNDDDDDELNDYGFNRRPSVRGIKAQFETTNEIVRQLRTRSAAANSLPEACRLGFSGTGHEDDVAASSSSSSDVYRVTYTNDIQTDPNTINRINTMQRQINDIYQSIAEGNVSGLLDQQRPGAATLSYLESTLPRMVPQQTPPDSCHRLPDHKNGLQGGTLLTPARMLRIAGGGDGAASATPPGVYSTLPRNHRLPSQQVSAAYSAGYSCGVLPGNAAAAAAAAAAAGAKCYRTMYFVPYNGMTDPTYQNIQRILPPHSSPPSNYAEHLERYPYPRNGTLDRQQSQQARYYVRPATIPNTQATSAALHLHLHQAEEFQLSATSTAARSQTLPHHSSAAQHQVQQQQQVQQVQQPQQLATSYVQTLSGATYSICPPPPPSQASATYTYQMQIQGRLSSSDMQTQTSCTPSSQISSGLLSSASLLANSSLPGSIGSGTSSLLSSPTKLPPQQYQPQSQQQQQPGSNMGSLQRGSSCSVAERGVPEGAASAPSHDYVVGSQASTGLLATTTQSAANIATSFVGGENAGGGGGGGGMVDAQNPVYYAMNV